MAIGVIANLVPFSDHPTDCFRVPFNPISDQEEGRFDVVFGEDIEQPISVRWIRSIVVGERDDPLVCV